MGSYGQGLVLALLLIAMGPETTFGSPLSLGVAN